MNCFSKTKYDNACRVRYRLLARECRKNGLEFDELRKSSDELSQVRGGISYLKEIAYKPTGLAIGCSLPDRHITWRLWRLARLVEKYLTAHYADKKAFTFVPPACYHITIVNRTHFDLTKIKKIISLDEREKLIAEEVINVMQSGPMVFHIDGLILTSNGRLLARGFPCDDRFYELRSRLVKRLPTKFSSNLAKTAYIKLGHILTPLRVNELHRFLKWLLLCGEHASGRFLAEDVYTPLGRLSL